MSRFRVLAAAVLIGGCGASGGGDTPDASVPGDIDAAVNVIDAGTGCTSNDQCENDNYCDTTAGVCKPYPTGMIDPTCTAVEVIGVFAPGVQCDWVAQAGDPDPTFANVIGTPAVVDFDFDGNRAALHPSIVFISTNLTGGGGAECAGATGGRGVIRVIDGADCHLQYTIDTVPLIASSPVAVGDLDGAADGRPEIVAHRAGGGVVAFKYNQATNTFGTLWETPVAAAAGVCLWSGPSIHDLDDDGIPEVIYGSFVLSGRTGAVIDSTVDSFATNYNGTGTIPVVADLESDNKPDLVNGDEIYKWDTVNRRWTARQALGAQGLTAVGDFGTFQVGNTNRAVKDGIPEIVVVSAGTIRIMTSDGRTVMPAQALPFVSGVCAANNAGTGGPPTIADFDGDGRLEVGVADRGAYVVFDPDCRGTPSAATCKALTTNYVLWMKRTQDCSSSVTGSSVFDFEGDGKAEVIYADECYSRVYDGATGDVLYSQSRNSCTWYENPVVADVDGDLKSEIVIPSNNNCAGSLTTCIAIDDQFLGLRCLQNTECPAGTTCKKENAADAFGLCRCTLDAQCGGNGYVCVDPVAGPSAQGKVCRASHAATPFQGVHVIKDALDRWVNSRPVWNQHAYSVTNVNDDGTIPKTSLWLENWLQPKLNNFRQNINGNLDPTQSPDATGGGDGFQCRSSGIILRAHVCNRGTAALGQGVPLSFYDGATLACTVRTTTTLAPGTCEQVSCLWPVAVPTTIAHTITGVADDDGTGRGENRECHEANNRLTLDDVQCVGVP